MTDYTGYCAHVEQFLPEYLQGALSCEDEVRIREHLGVCNHCTRIARDLAAVNRFLDSTLPEGHCSSDFDMQLMIRLLRYEQQSWIPPHLGGYKPSAMYLVRSLKMLTSPAESLTDAPTDDMRPRGTGEDTGSGKALRPGWPEHKAKQEA